MPLTKRIKAFTIIELLISMTLTVILVAFAFTAFNFMQKLFIDYSKQTKFITELNQLHNALFNLSSRATTIQKINDTSLIFKTDSVNTQLTINKENMLLKFALHTDTFHFECKNITNEVLIMSNDLPSQLIIKFDSDVYYKTQKFHVSFQKEYDAQAVLKSNLELQPPNEFN